MTKTPTQKAVYLKDYQPPAFRVGQVDLDFNIRDGETTVTSVCRYIANRDGVTDLVLDGEFMELVSVAIDGKKLSSGSYRLDEKTLTIPDVPKEFSLEVVTKFDPAKNTALEGLYKSGGNFSTQCEAEGFRRITYFQDRPDVMAPYTVRVEAPKTTCPVLLSNGNLKDSGDLPDGRHYALWSDPFPKPCYLFALVAGNLECLQDTFTTCSGKVVDLRIYVRHGDIPQCHHAMDSLKRAMKWDEEVYGREYHLDRFNIVAVNDFNMGAMENTSLNIFNTALVLAHPETATDMDFYRVESVIAHEYFHNWTGNRVTCRDWFQLSLKEGLTVFRDQEFSSDMNSRAVQRIDDAQTLRSVQFPEDGGPLAHPVRPERYEEINNFYTTTIYEKGSEVVRMQATLLGSETYRKATDLYFARHDGQAVTVEDFVLCMEESSGLDLSQFRLWYSQAGTPEISARTSYDAYKKTFAVTFAQHIPDTPEQTNKLPMFIPVAFGLLDKSGKEIVPTQVLHLKDKEETFIFENISSHPVPSILRGFSAPVRLSTDLSEDDLRFLMVHDTDGFNRWDASQILSLRLINRMIDGAEARHNTLTDHAFLEGIDSLLKQAKDGTGDKALLARMLALPDFSIISQERPVIEPDHIHLVTTKIKCDILDHSAGLLREIYDQLNVRKNYTPDPESMAERALKSVLLSYLTCRADDEAAKLAKAQYDAADNMTDRMMALSALADTSSTEREEALADFYERYKDHEVTLNKWFRVQAQAIRPQTLEDVRALSGHEKFFITNPNCVRSLFGAFGRNPVIFHKKDGSGYELFGKFIGQLDSINPQTSAQLLTILKDWRRYDALRQEKIKVILQDLLSKKNLSPNSREIISKMLGSQNE